MLLRHFFVALALSALLGFPPMAAATDEVQRVMAVVGDQVITTMDVERMLRSLEAQMPASRPGQMSPTDPQLKRLALERLVEDKILDIEAKRDKVDVGKEELNAFVERVRATNKLSEQEFIGQLASRGLTMDEYREELRRDIQRHKLLERNVRNRVVISNEQVDKALGQPGSAGQPIEGQVRLRAVFLQVAEDTPPAVEKAVAARAEELRKQVVGGADFAELARQHSQGPGAAQGGEMGPLASSDLLPAMRQALSELKPGGISPVLKIPAGYVFMQLLESGKAAAVSKPDTEQRAQVRAKLENEALEKRFQEWIKELRSKVYVRIIE